MRALLLYLALTLLVTWPMAARLHLMDAGDSAFFAWEIGWELHALGSDPTALPHANIFHPLRATLGLDEPILGTTLLVLPLRLFTSDAVLLFGLARLLTFAFSGLTTYLAAREWGIGRRAALVAGGAFTFSLIRCDQIGHLSTLGTQWLPLVLLFMHRFFRTEEIGDGLLGGGSFVLHAFACGYHGLIGLVVLPLVAVPLLWGRTRLLFRALPGVALAIAGLVPLYALHRAALRPQHFVRGPEETASYSASLETFLAAPWWSWLYGDLTAPFRSAGNELFMGVLPAVSIVLGAWGLLRRRERPSREAWALGTMGGVAALLALGPEIRLAGTTLMPGPFALLREWIPAFQMIRVPGRAGIYLALAAALLAARVWAVWEGRRWRMFLLLLIVLAESGGVSRPNSEAVAVVDSRKAPPPVYAWLAEQPGEFAMVELPMLPSGAPLYRPAYHESIYMLRSTRHWKRLVNGFAGMEPAHYVGLRETLRRFPNEEAVAALRGLGVRYVVLHSGGFGPLKWGRIERELREFAHALRLVTSAEGDYVYELAPS